MATGPDFDAILLAELLDVSDLPDSHVVVHLRTPDGAEVTRPFEVRAGRARRLFEPTR